MKINILISKESLSKCISNKRNIKNGNLFYISLTPLKKVLKNI